MPKKTWTGATGTDWNTDGNWNPSGVPMGTDDVTIPDVANDPVISGTTAAVAKIRYHSYQCGTGHTNEWQPDPNEHATSG